MKKNGEERKVKEIQIRDLKNDPIDSKQYKVFRVYEDGSELFWMGFLLKREAIAFGLAEGKRFDVPVRFIKSYTNKNLL